MYQRVVPRDLFNESKLLKCLGQLVLLIHDGKDKDNKNTPANLKFESEGEEFRIDQRQEDGGLYVREGVYFKVKARKLDLYSAYNCKKNAYPLMCMTEDYEELEVFHDDGTLTDDFCDYVNNI